MMKATIATIMLTTMFCESVPVNAGWFGPSDYDECVLEGMKNVSSDKAAIYVRQACDSKFLKDERQRQAKKWKHQAELKRQADIERERQAELEYQAELERQANLDRLIERAQADRKVIRERERQVKLREWKQNQQAKIREYWKNVQAERDRRAELKRQARRDHVNKIELVHKGSQKILSSKEFKSWVLSRPITKRDSYINIYNKGTAGQIIKMLDDYVEFKQEEQLNRKWADDIKLLIEEGIGGK